MSLDLVEVAAATDAALASLQAERTRTVAIVSTSSLGNDMEAAAQEALRLSALALPELRTLREVILAGGAGVHASPEAAYLFWVEYAENTYALLSRAQGYTAKWNLSGRLAALAVSGTQALPGLVPVIGGGLSLVALVLGLWLAIQLTRRKGAR